MCVRFPECKAKDCTRSPVILQDLQRHSLFHLDLQYWSVRGGWYNFHDHAFAQTVVGEVDNNHTVCFRCERPDVNAPETKAAKSPHETQ